MTQAIQGKRIAFLATDGVEEIELSQPWKAVRDAGARPELVSLKDGRIQAFRHLDKAGQWDVDVTVDAADAGGYQRAVSFTRRFFEDGKPVAAICHAPWVLAEADVVRGRRMTSWPTLRTDLQNAGANWVDEEVVTDDGLVTSRGPDDLKAFCAKLIEEIAEGRHSR
jgi:protease I